MKFIIAALLLLITSEKALSEDGIFEIKFGDKSIAKIENGYFTESRKVRKIESSHIKKVTLYDSPGSARGNHTVQIDLEGVSGKGVMMVMVLDGVVLLEEVSIGRSKEMVWLSIGSDDLSEVNEWLRWLKLLKKG